MRSWIPSQLGSLRGAHQTLPLLLRLHVLIPFISVLTIATGLLFTLPVGPLCDEGMVLFMEGGCDWGESNVFFFEKLNLLFAANLAFALSLRRREAPLRAWLPHLAVLCCLGWLMRSGGRCDTYYAHPNGSEGQMVLELAAFSTLGIALLRPLAHRPRSIQLLAGLGWNAAHVGVFYLWLSVTDHWTWTHTALICFTLLTAALAVLLSSPSPEKAAEERNALAALAGLVAGSAVAFLALRHFVGALAVDTGVMLAVMGWSLHRIAGWLRAPARLRLAVGIAVPAVAFLLPLGSVARSFLRAREANAPLRASVERALTLQAAQQLREAALSRGLREAGRFQLSALGSPATENAERILSAAPLGNGQSVRVFVPLEGGAYLFLWRNSHFTYADVRTLTSGGTEVINHEEISSILQSRRPVSSQLRADLVESIPFGMMRRPYVEGWPVQDAAGNVVAVGLTDTE